MQEKETLGCVNSPPSAKGSHEAGFTQPSPRLFCTSVMSLFNLSSPLCLKLGVKALCGGGKGNFSLECSPLSASMEGTTGIFVLMGLFRLGNNSKRQSTLDSCQAKPHFQDTISPLSKVFKGS